MKYDLSIIIPARNEEFLNQTINNILNNFEGSTEIIVVLDGQWAVEPIPQHERLTVVYHSESVGQRAAMNKAVKLSTAKYIMKVDAHCVFDSGFDVKMMNEMHDDWTLVPVMKNLHAFDWVCPNGHRRYQGPPGVCTICGKETKKDIVWRAKPSPNSTSYCFDRNLEFKYFGEYKKKQKGDIVDTMSLQGSCFMVTRKKYWELELCDESWGSWVQQGTEVALKTWLSGGRVACNKKTWYAHMFRTQKGFSWPYPAPGESQRKAREISRRIFLNDSWPKAKRKLGWLVAKFAPVPDWHGKQISQKRKPSKGVVYYTDNRIDKKMMLLCQKQILKGIKEKHIISVSLEPIEFGRNNICLPLKRGYLTMFRQILAGLEANDAEVIFFCEHDVLYHPSHFDFIPPKRDVFYYNLNIWKVRAEDGHGLKVDDCKQTSGLCAYRELLIGHYRRRIAKILRNQANLIERGEPVKNEGFSRHMGFEPGCHTPPRGVDNFKAGSWVSKFPNIDIRHDKNLTPNRWKKEQFRDKRYTKGWLEAKYIPGWGKWEDIKWH